MAWMFRTRLAGIMAIRPLTSECVRARLAQASQAIAALAASEEALCRMIAAVHETIGAGGAILTCGNGGSAAEAMHMSEELIGRYRSNRAPLRAICLNADPTAITCIANDFGFDEVFARQLEGLGCRGDLLIVFSTSGRSPNILRALEVARSRSIKTIGLLGKDGSPAAALCDHHICIPGADSAAAQEAHQMVVHMLCESLEPD